MAVVRAEVEVSNKNLERALRTLKRKTQREGLIREIRKNRYYEKPSAVRRRKELKAARRRNKANLVSGV
ncbi:MAG: 30S ribosomal protein S21 [Candidatus Schekmanbacteria bacterium]|nr:30S ribosomal protein S21 [Candidatus Schekmanbacteria bacterium]